MKVLTLGPAGHERVVLFAAGAGGDPERYRPLLEHLATHGCQVIAPYFERLVAREPATAELLTRPAGLVEALHQWASPDAAVVVAGHSIGGWAALCLAGATPWGRDGKPLDVPREPRVSRLALYAPAAGWFAAPGALDAVTVPMLVYVGALDTITPVEQVTLLKSAPAEVDFRIVPRAGHFSFMKMLPPGVADDDAFDRDRFLTDLARTTLEFATASLPAGIHRPQEAEKPRWTYCDPRSGRNSPRPARCSVPRRPSSGTRANRRRRGMADTAEDHHKAISRPRSSFAGRTSAG